MKTYSLTPQQFTALRSKLLEARKHHRALGYNGGAELQEHRIEVHVHRGGFDVEHFEEADSDTAFYDLERGRWLDCRAVKGFDGLASPLLGGVVTFALQLGAVRFPDSTGIAVNMMPFILGQSDSLPDPLRVYQRLIDACGVECDQIGKVCYLSIQESAVSADRPNHRRPGIHTEGHPAGRWGGGWGKGRMDGSRHGGIYMASTVGNSCRFWNCEVEPGPMGDCEHLREALGTGDVMQNNALYWMTDRTPHESLSLKPGTFRQWFRLVTSEVDIWYERHSTPNSMVRPPCRVIGSDKFAHVERIQPDAKL